MNLPIICEICGKEINQMDREIPPSERKYKADMTISHDAYWNDAGIFTIMNTRKLFHKRCFEDARDWYKRQMVKERD